MEQIVKRFSDQFATSMWPNPVLICSLTRAAAAEVAGRNLPIRRQAVGTLHAHCFRSLPNPIIVEAKHIEQWNEVSSWKLSLPEGKTDDWDAKTDGFMITNSGDELLAELDLVRHQLVPESEWSRDLRRFAGDWREFKQEQEVYDFTDLIESTLAQGEKAPGNPAVIMVDEAQDLSALEYKLVMMWSEFSSATIIVGDPWQVLYSWRGADPKIFSDDTVPEDHQRILGQSYRVPERVVNVARNWMEDFLDGYYPIEYKPRQNQIGDEDVRGKVGVREANIYSPDPVVEEAMEFVASGKTVMFQASCSYMLPALIGALRDRGIPYANPWRLSQAYWNPLGGPVHGVALVQRLREFVCCCSDVPEREGWDWTRIMRWTAPMRVKNTLTHGAKKKIEAAASTKFMDEDGNEVDDLAGVSLRELEPFFTKEAWPFIRSVALGEVTAYEATCWWQQRLLAQPKKSSEYYSAIVQNYGISGLNDDPKVFIGTIHSFKGSEADVVYVFPDLSNAGFKEWQRGASEERNSIVRLFYVAMTRAKQELYICRNASKVTAPLRREVQRYADANEEKSNLIPI